MGTVDERLAGEAAMEGRLLRGQDSAALRLPHPRGGRPQFTVAAQGEKKYDFPGDSGAKLAPISELQLTMLLFDDENVSKLINLIDLICFGFSRCCASTTKYKT